MNDFEWPRVTAKYSVTRSMARSLCDSWASCLKYRVHKIERTKGTKGPVDNITAAVSRDWRRRKTLLFLQTQDDHITKQWHGSGIYRITALVGTTYTRVPRELEPRLRHMRRVTRWQCVKTKARSTAFIICCRLTRMCVITWEKEDIVMN